MKPLRWLLAGLLWILTGVVALLGVIACVTVILLPLGVPLLLLARRLATAAGKLVVPKAVRHPIRELGAKSSQAAEGLGKRGRRAAGAGREAVTTSAPKKAAKARKQVVKKLRRRTGLKA
jgi:hypothetical protein